MEQTTCTLEFCMGLVTHLPTGFRGNPAGGNQNCNNPVVNSGNGYNCGNMAVRGRTPIEN